MTSVIRITVCSRHRGPQLSAAKEFQTICCFQSRTITNRRLGNRETGMRAQPIRSVRTSFHKSVACFHMKSKFRGVQSSTLQKNFRVLFESAERRKWIKDQLVRLGDNRVSFKRIGPSTPSLKRYSPLASITVGPRDHKCVCPIDRSMRKSHHNSKTYF